MTIDEILELGPVLPVLTIANSEDAAPLAEALKAGGLRALEITLRTSEALAAIRAVVRIDAVIAGAGTVLGAEGVRQAAEAGARFVVSPGLSDAVAAACRDAAMPYLPGVATATDIMRALDLGLTAMKFFPAEPAGGIAALRALAGPFPTVRFCPTGGLGPDNFTDYLVLPNVVTVGGSWPAPEALIRKHAWAKITERAAATMTHVKDRTGGSTS